MKKLFIILTFLIYSCSPGMYVRNNVRAMNAEEKMVFTVSVLAITTGVLIGTIIIVQDDTMGASKIN
jgi:hypothetical protein